MKRIKDEKGAITLITLITILFMILFLMTSYILIANKVKTQKEMLSETKAIYEPKLTMEEIYNSYFTGDSLISIYTVEQLLSIGNNQKINIDGKIYIFANNANTTYLLKNDLEFNAVDLELETDWIPPYEDANFIANFDWNGHKIKVTKLNGETIIYDGTYIDTVTDYPINLTNAIKTDLIDYKIYGNSIQNGTPTPDTPIEIESVGERTKNLIVPIKPKGYTQITNGITFEVLDDYSIHTYGEPTKDYTAVYMGTVDMSTLVVGQTYRLSGCPVAVGSANSTYNLNAQIRRNGVYVSAINDYGSGSIVWTMKEEYLDCILYPYITIRDTFDLHWYPKFETGNVITDYEPYGYKIPVKVSNGTNETTTNIYLDEPLRKVGDYADYIDFENKIVVRKIGKLIYDGSEGWGNYPQGKGYLVGNATFINGQEVICNIFNNSNSLVQTLAVRKNYNNIYALGTSDYYTTNDDWKTFLNTTNMILIGKLITQIEEELELPNVSLYKGKNTITVDTTVVPSNISITYNAKQ